MAEITRRVGFYSVVGEPRTLHIETDGAIVNITVGLHDVDGRPVTRVDTLPDDESRGGDEHGRIWEQDGPRIICQTTEKVPGKRSENDFVAALRDAETELERADMATNPGSVNESSVQEILRHIRQLIDENVVG